jgi:hypothetical protein
LRRRRIGAVIARQKRERRTRFDKAAYRKRLPRVELRSGTRWGWWSGWWRA